MRLRCSFSAIARAQKVIKVVNIAQTRRHRSANLYTSDKASRMLTSAECQAKANEKFEQAERNPRNQKRLLAAAEGWAALAEILRRHEATLISPRFPKDAPLLRLRRAQYARDVHTFGALICDQARVASKRCDPHHFAHRALAPGTYHRVSACTSR